MAAVLLLEAWWRYCFTRFYLCFLFAGLFYWLQYRCWKPGVSRQAAVPLLSTEGQHPPPHFSLSADASFSSRSTRCSSAARSTSQPQDPDPEPEPRPRPRPEPDGTSLILWVRTSGEPGLRSISLPGKTESEVTGGQSWSGLSPSEPVLNRLRTGLKVFVGAGVCLYLLARRPTHRPVWRSPKSPPAANSQSRVSPAHRRISPPTRKPAETTNNNSQCCTVHPLFLCLPKPPVMSQRAQSLLSGFEAPPPLRLQRLTFTL